MTIVIKNDSGYIECQMEGEYMKLKLYLVKNRISITDFSKLLRCSRGHLTGIVNGKIKPSRILAELIEGKTNGRSESKRSSR